MSTIRVGYLFEQCWHRVPGGTAVAAVGLARALTDLADIELVGFAARHRSPPTGSISPPLPITHFALPRFILYETWHLLSWPSVDRRTGFTDIVHASGGSVPATSRPLVATIHDLSWRHQSAWATRRGRRFAESWLGDARRADKVLCPSKATYRDLLNAGFDEKKLKVVPLGVEPFEVEPSRPAALRAAWGLTGPFVLWVGTIEPRKNLQTLLKAMERTPEIPLVIVGPIGWAFDQLAIPRKLEKQIHLVGPVGEADKHAWYAAADVFCYPSLLEGFGLPVAEAMVQGTPVVTSVGTATEEVAGDAALVVDPEDPSAIAQSIESLLSDQDLCLRLAAAGRKRASELTWKAAANSTEDAYREVLGR